MNASAESMADGEYPVVREFLDFLTRDMKCHPARLQAVDLALVHRLQARTRDITADLDRRLSLEDD